MPKDEEDPLLESRPLTVDSKDAPGWFNTPRKHQTWRHRMPSIFTVVCVLWVVGGVVAAERYENWDFLTAVYVITQIITTIGYGDITVTTPAAKIFCSFYVIGTVVLIGTFLTDLADKMLAGNVEMLREKVREIQLKMNPGAAQTQSSKPSKYNFAIAAFLLFAFFVGVGTVFFALYEPCSCSYGTSRIAGCEDGTGGQAAGLRGHSLDEVTKTLSWKEAKAAEKRCAETGGAVKTWTDAFYMSVITLTTVGFGDHSPKTQVGRALGIGWMILGVVACGTFVSAVGALVLEQKKATHQIKRMSPELFRKIDKDGSGELSHLEFRTYALLKWGICREEDLAEIDRIFEAIDADGSESLTYLEIQKYCDDPPHWDDSPV